MIPLHSVNINKIIFSNKMNYFKTNKNGTCVYIALCKHEEKCSLGMNACNPSPKLSLVLVTGSSFITQSLNHVTLWSLYNVVIIAQCDYCIMVIV